MKITLIFICGIIWGYYLSPIFNAIKKVFKNAYKEYKNSTSGNN